MKYDDLRDAFMAKGFQFLKRPYEINISGIRSSDHTPDTFNDFIVAAYTDVSGNGFVQVWPATTDPGAYWLRNPLNPSGTAILKEGQYIGSHAIGTHRNKYLALVQVKPVTVYRDAGQDGYPDTEGAKTQTGLFGINIHRALENGTTKYVDKFSAGCQVFANAADFRQLMALCQQHRLRYGNSFNYTLLSGISKADALYVNNPSTITYQTAA